MIDPTADKSDKLKAARTAFEASYDHYSNCNEERRLWARCHHNTDGKGQWPESVIRVLDEQKRPYWSFNLVHGKVHQFVGMQRDVRRSPIAKPIGREDRFLAGVVNTISGRLRYKAKAARCDARVLKNGAIRGEGDAQLYVSRDPKRPTWFQVEYKQLSPHQVNWDPSATEQDRSDARYVCVSTWMDRGQFSRRYPNHKRHFDTLRKGSLVGDASVLEYDTETFQVADIPDEYDKSRSGKYYFDEKRKLIRVISIEYKYPVKKWHVVSESGQMRALGDMEMTGFDGETLGDDDKREMLQLHIQAGLLPGASLVSSFDDEIYWLEFVGSEILYDSRSPQPYDGFSIVPFVFYLDDETNTPYGMVRNLIDPQTQLNKSYCLTIESSASQAKPGLDIEKSAHDDPDLLEDQIQTSGSVAVFNDGAISGQKIRDRTVPQMSSAAEKRLENDIRFIDRVSGVCPESENVHQAEAALTHQLRNHKARLVHQDAFEAFEDYQTAMEHRLMQTIIRALPDDQIAALLGNDEKYRVQRTPMGMMIYEIAVDPQNPQAQPQIVNQAMLEQFRTLEADIELEASQENTELRMVEFNILTQLIGVGIPIPPELILERAIQNAADRELAIDYAKQAAQQAAQAQQAQGQQMMTQLQQMAQLEAMNQQERSRHNVAEEQLKAQKQLGDWFARMAEIWEKADASEKDYILGWLRELQQRQAMRGQMISRALPAERTLQ